jgi:chromosome segregation ATPase
MQEVVDRGEERRKKAEHTNRLRDLQREIEELYAELDKTEDGRGIRAKLMKADKDLRKYLLPIVTQLDDLNIESAKKTGLQKKMEEEYSFAWREFRGHFAEVRAMHIEIGPNLRSFYGLPDPVSNEFS